MVHMKLSMFSYTSPAAFSTRKKPPSWLRLHPRIRIQKMHAISTFLMLLMCDKTSESDSNRFDQHQFIKYSQWFRLNPSLMIPTYSNYSTFALRICQANPSLSLGLFLDMFKGFHGNSRCPRIWSPVHCPGNCTGCHWLAISPMM